MIKGQVLTGGRGKAGAIRAVSAQAEAESAAREILGMSVNEFPVKAVLVTERIDIEAEYYLAITIDREAKSVVLIVSAAGGMDIEQVAAERPDEIQRLALRDGEQVGDRQGMGDWLREAFRDEDLVGQAVGIVQNMYRLFRENGCSLVEINPLVGTTQGQLVAVDAKIVVDDNALAQLPEIARYSNAEEYTPDELEAQAAGLSFVSLSGEIGCMVNGAGLAMATMDGIKFAGGAAANFLDVGGSSNPEKVLTAMTILLRNEQLKVILINIFGGITRCDDIAQGILWARDQLSLTIPMVIRLVGTNDEAARKMLSEAGLTVLSSMSDAIQHAVGTAQGEVSG